MLSGYLEQRYGSFGESIVVPTMYAMMLATPLLLLPRTKSPQLAFAIGQYVAIRREALDAVGGFEAIKHSIVDDMSMAIRVKQFGYREIFLDERAAASCRLYSGYRNAFVGIKRSIYSAVGGRPVTAVVMSVLIIGVIVAPPVLALVTYARIGALDGLLALAVALFAA